MIKFSLQRMSCALVSLILFGNAASAAMPGECGDRQEAVIAAGEIPLFAENPEKGVFVEMVKEAAKRAGIQVNVAVLPKKRAVAYFTGIRVDALVPHPKGHPSASGHPSFPVLVKRNFAYVRKGDPPPRTIANLVGKTVGLTAQYYYSDELLNAEGIRFVQSAQSDSINLSMLNRGRIDVAIVEEISGNEAVRKSGLEGEVVYDENNPISALEVVMLFSLSDCGKALEKAFSRSLRTMELDGVTREIKQRYNIPPGQ